MDKDVKRFLSKVEIDEKTGCWNWKAGVEGNGYGTFWWRGKDIKAPRFSYMHFYDRPDLQPTELVLHTCDNRLCVNPEHLYCGTHTDNRKDMYSRGRGEAQRKHMLEYHASLRRKKVDMKCPNCGSSNVRVEESGRSCFDCFHVWEKEDDGTKVQRRVPRVFCPNCNVEMDPTRRTCSECGTPLQ